MTLVQQEPKKIYLGSTAVSKVYLGSTQVRPVIPPYLCFTANSASSTVKLQKTGSPTSVTLETSTDGQNWSTYTFGSTITLSNIGDKVYFRNTSTTTTGFSTATSAYYYFTLTGSINASGDITSLISKNCTTTLNGNYCFSKLFYNSNTNAVLKTPPLLPATSLTGYCYYEMFYNCTGLTKTSSLPSTTLEQYCYAEMFYNCTNLEEIPNLPATTLVNYCYNNMFRQCSKIKLSATQTGQYQTPYRIPTTGTGTTASYALTGMFGNTGGSWAGTASINTTYYTTNTVV